MGISQKLQSFEKYSAAKPLHNFHTHKNNPPKLGIDMIPFRVCIYIPIIANPHCYLILKSCSSSGLYYGLIELLKSYSLQIK